MAPSNARYRLYGKVREGSHGAIRVTVQLIDALTGRYLWAAAWDGEVGDSFGFEERVAHGVARAIQPAIREAEIDRVVHLRHRDLTACPNNRRVRSSVRADAGALPANKPRPRGGTGVYLEP